MGRFFCAYRGHRLCPRSPGLFIGRMLLRTLLRPSLGDLVTPPGSDLCFSLGARCLFHHFKIVSPRASSARWGCFLLVADGSLFGANPDGTVSWRFSRRLLVRALDLELVQLCSVFMGFGLVDSSPQPPKFVTLTTE